MKILQERQARASVRKTTGQNSDNGDRERNLNTGNSSSSAKRKLEGNRDTDNSAGSSKAKRTKHTAAAAATEKTLPRHSSEASGKGFPSSSAKGHRQGKRKISSTHEQQPHSDVSAKPRDKKRRNDDATGEGSSDNRAKSTWGGHKRMRMQKKTKK